MTSRTRDGTTRRFRGRVLDVDPPETIRWRGHRWTRRLFEGEHVLELQRRGPDQTKLVHRERFEGLLVPIFVRRDLDRTRLAFETMNRALKDHVESDDGTA